MPTDQALHLFAVPQAPPDAAPPGPEGGLFSSNPLQYGAGPTETEAVATLEALHAKRPLTSAQRLQAQVIRSLAVNIDRGNHKGRAVGNEAMQLMAALDALTADDPTAGAVDALPEETRTLLDALSAPPIAPAWADPAPARDTA